MTKQSRLRIHQGKTGRRVVLYLLFIVFLSCTGYLVEQKFGYISRIKEHLDGLKSTLGTTELTRGTIYDRNLKQLAVNMERVSVYARTREVESIPNTAKRLGLILDLDPKKIQDQLESGVLRPWLAEGISQEQEELVKEIALPGIYFHKEERRYYPNDNKAAHLLGYVEDGIGLSGVEFYYDRLLATRKLQQQEEQKPLSIAQDLILTVDLKIQNILEQLVGDITENEQAEKVSAYLVESETGEIVAGAQFPGFNPNNFTRYNQSQMENMFFAPIFLPEAFRLLVRDCANLYVDLSKTVTPPAWSVINYKRKLGNQLRLWEWLGLGETSGADFHVPAKNDPLKQTTVSPVRKTKYDFGLIPETATPMSVLTAFSVLLNGGDKKRPFVVKKILDQKTGTEVLLSVKNSELIEDPEFFSHNLKEIKLLFQSWATKGESGSYFFWDSVLITENLRNTPRFSVHDFVYATIPAGETNLNMLVVVKKNPQSVQKKGKRGQGLISLLSERVSLISGLHQVAKSVEDVNEITPINDINIETKSFASKRERLLKRGNEKKLQGQPGVMPDLVGLSLRKSLRLLQGMNVEIQIEGTGRVTKQYPLPGKAIKGKIVCKLTLEKHEDMRLEVLEKNLSE